MKATYTRYRHPNIDHMVLTTSGAPDDTGPRHVLHIYLKGVAPWADERQPLVVPLTHDEAARVVGLWTERACCGQAELLVED